MIQFGMDFRWLLGRFFEAKLLPKFIKKLIMIRLASWIEFLMNFWVGGATQELPHGGVAPYNTSMHLAKEHSIGGL